MTNAHIKDAMKQQAQKPVLMSRSDLCLPKIEIRFEVRALPDDSKATKRTSMGTLTRFSRWAPIIEEVASARPRTMLDSGTSVTLADLLLLFSFKVLVEALSVCETMTSTSAKASECSNNDNATSFTIGVCCKLQEIVSRRWDRQRRTKVGQSRE